MYTLFYLQIKPKLINFCRKYRWVHITYWMTRAGCFQNSFCNNRLLYGLKRIKMLPHTVLHQLSIILTQQADQSWSVSSECACGKSSIVRKGSKCYLTQCYINYLLSWHNKLISPDLSHLSVRVVNHLLCENRKSIPKFFNGKKLFKNVTLQILNFILVSNKKFPHMVQCLICVSFHCIKQYKKQRKFNITPYNMGKIFIS